MAQRETARHREAFEFFYEHNRSVPKTAEEFKVSDRAARNWCDRFGWHKRADERDVEVERQLSKQAIQRKAQMVENHRKAGELVRKRGVEYFAKNAIRTEGTALSAIGKGIEIERTAEGMPAWMVAMMGMDDAELAAYIATATGTPQASDGAADGEGTGTDDPSVADDPQ